MEAGLDETPSAKMAERLTMNLFLAHSTPSSDSTAKLSFDTFLRCGFASGPRVRLCYRNEYPPVIVET
jgi:hypothetical protein